MSTKNREVVHNSTQRYYNQAGEIRRTYLNEVVPRFWDAVEETLTARDELEETGWMTLQLDYDQGIAITCVFTEIESDLPELLADLNDLIFPVEVDTVLAACQYLSKKTRGEDAPEIFVTIPEHTVLYEISWERKDGGLHITAGREEYR